MNELAGIQIIILTLYAGLAILDEISFNVGLNGIIQTAVFTGLMTGHPELGLFIGATFQAYALGLSTYGGSSVPNWSAAAMLVTALAVDKESAATLMALIGVPLATLGVQFDVLGRMANMLVQRKADEFVLQSDLKKIEMMNITGAISWFVSRALPMLLALTIGRMGIEAIVMIVDTNAGWILNGAIIAGRLLPGIGFAILLRRLPLKRHVSWLIIGFVIAAYLDISILGITLIGLAAALIVYRHSMDHQHHDYTADALIIGGEEDEL